MSRTPQEEAAFLKYFFSTYIPPFTHAIPRDEETFKDIYLSAADVWDNFSLALDTYSFSDQLKKELKYLFCLYDNLWESYLCTPDGGFNAWVLSPEVQQSWSKIQTKARTVHKLAENR